MFEEAAGVLPAFKGHQITTKGGNSETLQNTKWGRELSLCLCLCLENGAGVSNLVRWLRVTREMLGASLLASLLTPRPGHGASPGQQLGPSLLVRGTGESEDPCGSSALPPAASTVSGQSPSLLHLASQNLVSCPWLSLKNNRSSSIRKLPGASHSKERHSVQCPCGSARGPVPTAAPAASLLCPLPDPRLPWCRLPRP